jgi:ketosteroid isomerase-like protein
VAAVFTPAAQPQAALNRSWKMGANIVAYQPVCITQTWQSLNRRINMTGIGVSRRKALEAGACALAGAAGLLVTASAHPETATSTATEAIIRQWYRAWEQKDLDRFEALMAENFTFSSAAGDDHISRSTFKTQCWDTQAKLIDQSDLERVIATGNDAFVKYLCHTKNGKSFRNVEYFRIRDGKVESLECYFGGAGYPSAASKGM